MATKRTSRKGTSGNRRATTARANTSATAAFPRGGGISILEMVPFGRDGGISIGGKGAPKKRRTPKRKGAIQVVDDSGPQHRVKGDYEKKKVFNVHFKKKVKGEDVEMTRTFYRPGGAKKAAHAEARKGRDVLLSIVPRKRPAHPIRRAAK